MELAIQVVVVYGAGLALFLVVGIMLKRIVKGTRDSFDKTPARAFGVGLATILVFAALFVGSVSLVRSTGLDFLYVLVVLVLLLFSIGILVGFTAATQTVGARIFPNQAAMMQNTYGAGVVILAILIPFFGEFILFPFILISGFGGAALSFNDSRKK